MFWGPRAKNFSIYTTKMEGAGPQILGTGAKFKRVPCLKSCRVNRAIVYLINNKLGPTNMAPMASKTWVLRNYVPRSSLFYRSVVIWMGPEFTAAGYETYIYGP